jgi:hypothetical protein
MANLYVALPLHLARQIWEVMACQMCVVSPHMTCINLIFLLIYCTIFVYSFFSCNFLSAIYMQPLIKVLPDPKVSKDV